MWNGTVIKNMQHHKKLWKILKLYLKKMNKVSYSISQNNWKTVERHTLMGSDFMVGEILRRYAGYGGLGLGLGLWLAMEWNLRRNSWSWQWKLALTHPNVNYAWPSWAKCFCAKWKALLYQGHNDLGQASLILRLV